MHFDNTQLDSLFIAYYVGSTVIIGNKFHIPTVSAIEISSTGFSYNKLHNNCLVIFDNAKIFMFPRNDVCMPFIFIALFEAIINLSSKVFAKICHNLMSSLFDKGKKSIDFHFRYFMQNI